MPQPFKAAQSCIHPRRAFNGVLAFVSDTALGDKAPKIKAGLEQAFEGRLLRDFENLLFSHGEPLVGDGKAALRRLVKSPIGHEEFGDVP